MTANKKELANKLSDNLEKIVNEEGITHENIDKVIEELGDFPYDKTDLQTIKEYLNEKQRQETTGAIEAGADITPSEKVEAKASANTKSIFEELDKLSEEPTSADRARIKEIYDTNPKVAEVNRRFKEITKQLEAEGKLKKICP